MTINVIDQEKALEQCFNGKWHGCEYGFSGGFCDQVLNDLANKCIEQLMDKYTFLGAGRNRAVFLLKSKNYVLKFPITHDGMVDNDWESSLLCNAKESNPELDIQYPYTRSIIYNDFPCVVMERIQPIWIEEDFKGLPNWIDCCDGHQVGFNKNGELKVYDYGYR